ncbi:MAG: hypothetical protein F8N39_11550 [Clostridiaceae bacterium]|nr:hypothetical protein [Clostridiaceae bacterium]
MALTATNVLSFGAISESFGNWCQHFAVKDLMASFGVAEQTAKRWRAGKLPESLHLAAMVERWGQPFLDTIFAPALSRVERDLVGQMESVEVQISSMRERMVNEARRRDRLCVAAHAGGLDAGLDVGGAPVVGAAAERRGGMVGGKGGALATLSHGMAGALGGVILLIAAFHGPISDLLDGGDDFAGRTGRNVVAARVLCGKGRRA